jgi:hypothetical protein
MPMPDLSFLPDKPNKKTDLSFLPNQPSSKDDLSFLPDKTTPAIESDYEVSTGTASTVKKPVSGALKVKDYSPLGAIWTSLKEPAKQSREGLAMIEKKIFNPDRETTGDISTIKELPRTLAKTAFGTASEMSAGSIEPESLITMGLLKGGGKLAQTAKGKSILSKISNVIPESVKKATITRYGQPTEYQDLAKLRKVEIVKGKEAALNIGKGLTEGLSRAEQQRAGQILKGSITTAKTSPKIVEATTAARSALQDVGGQAVEQGLLDKQTFLKNLQTYSPRLYRVFEKPNLKMPGTNTTTLEALSNMTPEQLAAVEKLPLNAAQKVIDYAKNTRATSLYGGVKPMKIKGEAFKPRIQGLSEDYKAALGEIKEPGMPVAKRLFQTKKDVETAKLFNKVSANPEWTSDVAKPDMIQLPESKGLGNLSGKFVNKYIADDINDITKVSTEAEKVWNKTIGLWKAGKVIINPSTHARNMMSNSMLLDLSGVDQGQQLRLLPKAGKELFSKGKYFAEAKEAGLIGNEYYGQEIKNLLDNWEGVKQASGLMKILEIPKYLGRKAGNLYQAEEQWFKMAKFIAEREKGSSIKEAASQANKWMFDYSEVPKFIDTLRKSPLGAPFATFTYKALPRVAESLVNNPTKVYKYKLLFDAIDKQSGKGEEQRYASEKAALPEYMKGGALTGKNVRLPFKDKYNRSLYFDLTYILPWGDLGESGGKWGIPGSLTPGGLIKPIVESAVNYSLFKQGTIYNESDLPTEKYGKIMDYLYKAYMPSLAPEIPGTHVKGGYSYQKLKGAVKGTPDWMGRTNTVFSAVASTLAGLKTIPIDLGEEQGRRVNEAKKQIQEIKQAFGRISKNPATTPKEQLRAEKNLELKINNIMEKLSEQIQ